MSQEKHPPTGAYSTKAFSLYPDALADEESMSRSARQALDDASIEFPTMLGLWHEQVESLTSTSPTSARYGSARPDATGGRRVSSRSTSTSWASVRQALARSRPFRLQTLEARLGIPVQPFGLGHPSITTDSLMASPQRIHIDRGWYSVDLQPEKYVDGNVIKYYIDDATLVVRRWHPLYWVHVAAVVGQTGRRLLTQLFRRD